MSKKESLPVPINSYAAFALDKQDIVEVLQENFEGSGFAATDLERVKVPSGGGQLFMRTDASGEEHAVKHIDGVIIYKHAMRVYFDKPMSESSGEPPVCFSDDGMIGHGNPGGDCATCPLSQFPDGGGRQACKQQERLFILEDGKILPTVFVVPPTGLKVLRKYLVTLSSSVIPYWSVVTRISLEKCKSKQGIDYAEPRFGAQEIIAPGEQRDKIRAYRETILPSLRAVREYAAASEPQAQP